ncbi:Na+/H+ antiporter family protein [Rossellomorea aquimaris]|jgi:putative amino acid transporter|uniref:Na+/H+ antiporter family protein n=1 Tax=Rossellomorea aquimaris TaxID=189382 RepID=A0A5D4TKQ4_9BACI|nr:Na+/H+ antiporter family protein [Rossellomorea aquimaris]TYS75905.1 Na+/H+ antiporter family protein [Rossellomorea aquimaris]TYS81166.1 Na+/H+ antiporter family protein [Rossellomorea aquimaris]
MNAVVIAVLVMLVLSLVRVNVVFALITGALVGGLAGGLGLNETISIFTEGISGGASIALSYALLGGFAVAISYTGIPNLLVDWVLKVVGKKGDSRKTALSKALIVLSILIMACFSQNVIPIHIAFIPILIPPLLKVMTELRIDRRLIASVITFGLTAPYILLPVGFGLQFHEIIAQNMGSSGMEIALGDIPKAMLIPVGGMVIGLLIAVFVSYRKPREYIEREEVIAEEKVVYNKRAMIFALVSIVVALYVQLQLESMIFGALAGIAVLYITGSVKWKEADGLLNDGMKMMAFIGFVMITASGFAEVVKATGDVETLVEATADVIGGNQALAALIMLIVGLLVTMGIGSSFATIPIIAAIFVPLAMELGFSPLATIAIVGTAGALGDAGSPASDSTLGPTAGLNADGQHNHIWDTCVPTFLHYNIPLILFGWIAAIIL